MKNTLYLLGLTLAVYACGPKNEEVKDEQVTVAPPAEALDSIANTKKDGVLTDENDTNPTMPMPQPVMQLLSRQYTGWQQPALTAEARQQAADYVQGPMIVRGDFDGDSRQDLALQLQQGNDIVIVAALQEQDTVYKLQELKRDILFNERGKLKSLYYLYLVEQGKTLYNEDSEEAVDAAHDAIAVGIEGDDTAFLYNNGAFDTYSVSK